MSTEKIFYTGGGPNDGGQVEVAVLEQDIVYIPLPILKASDIPRPFSSRLLALPPMPIAGQQPMPPEPEPAKRVFMVYEKQRTSLGEKVFAYKGEVQK